MVTSSFYSAIRDPALEKPIVSDICTLELTLAINLKNVWNLEKSMEVAQILRHCLSQKAGTPKFKLLIVKETEISKFVLCSQINKFHLFQGVISR